MRTKRPAPNRQREFSRRRFLRTGTYVAGGALALTPTAWHHSYLTAAANADATPDLKPLNRFPRMVQEHLVRELRRFELNLQEQRRSLRTREDAEAYILSVQERIRQAFGPLPEKNPLQPRVTGVLQRDGYRIEKILFESRPGFLVTANLYLPNHLTKPAPGVIGTCGHSSNGKAEAAYQSFCQGLVRQGYVVLIYDPIGQGERLQYPDDQRTSRVGIGVREHLLAGNQQFLVDEFIGTWRAWDGIRALDYLLTRPEVDPQHLGVTGNSGGGTLTTWLCGLEPRFTMAAPGCFVTTFRRNLENELPADTEQCPPRVLALGLDHADFLAALAPRPIIVLAKEKDFFDVRGAEEAYARLQQLYRLLGAEENIALFVGPTEHGYSQENREAMYRWFNRVTGVSSLTKEPEVHLEKDEDLWCTPQGQVSDLNSRTVFGFTAQKSRQLTNTRRPLSNQELKRSVSQILRLQHPNSAPDYRILRTIGSRRYPLPRCTTYAIETEPGIQAIVYRLSPEPHGARPPKMQDPVHLYVSHHSADAELRTETLVQDLAKAAPNQPLFACDLRGVGESRPDTCGEDMFLHAYGSDYFYAIHSLMLDRPYLGQRTFDLLRVLEWFQSFGGDKVEITALGWGTLPALFATLLSDQVVSVTLKNAPRSYAEIAETEIYHWPLSSFLPGVLTQFDLPDCTTALQGKPVRFIDST